VHELGLTGLPLTLQTLPLHKGADFRVAEAGRVDIAGHDEVPDLLSCDTTALLKLRDSQQITLRLGVAQDSAQAAQFFLIG
jgi:hypothetical protein